MTRDLQIGDIFTGKVVRLANFGAFVELVPGKDGLLRDEEMGEMDDGLKMGQEVTVMILEIDHMGRINLSRKALYEDKERPRPMGTRPPSRPFSGPGGRGRGPARGPRGDYGQRR